MKQSPTQTLKLEIASVVNPHNDVFSNQRSHSTILIIHTHSLQHLHQLSFFFGIDAVVVHGFAVHAWQIKGASIASGKHHREGALAIVAQRKIGVHT